MNKKIIKYTQQLIAQLGPKPTIIVGLSGGPDSVFLLHQLKQLSDAGFCTLVAAHLNHGWRTEAADDAAWCKALCEQLAIPFVADHGDNYPVDKKYDGSAEAVGRKKRQLFYAAIKAQYQAAAIALGHHQDDQLETFFIRLARGTSLSGLHGMDPFDGTYLRPLLYTSKQEILDWLTKNEICFLTDATNAQDKYLRNRIRHHVVPALQQCDQRFGASITNTMARLKDEDAFLDELTKTTFAQLFEEDKKPLILPAIRSQSKNVGSKSQERAIQTVSLSAFLAIPPTLQQRIIIHWLILEKVAFTPSEGLIEEILRFLRHPNGGSHQISHSHTFIKKNQHIWLVRV